MKNKITTITLLLMVSSITMNISAVFGNNNNAGSSALNGMFLGAGFGGLTGGRQGATYGALAGGLIGAASGAAAENQRQNYGNYNRNDTRYNPNSRSSMRDYIAQIERENQDLRNENYDLMRQLNTRRR